MALPTLIQYAASSTIPGAGGGDNTLDLNAEFRIRLPNPSLPGNCLVACWKSEASTTSAGSVTDDKGNTWAAEFKHVDTTNGATVHIAYTVNATTGTREIRIKNTDATTAGFFRAWVAEFNNIVTSSNANALDGAGVGADGTSTTPAAGSKTPSVSNDLVIMAVAPDNGRPSSYTAGSQANISWALIHCDRLEGGACQWGVYTTTAAFSPSMTFGSSTGWSCAALFLKSASAGTPRPTTMWVCGIHHISMSGSLGAYAISNPFVCQVPLVGNLAVGAYSSGSPDFKITGITDSVGPAWLQLGPGVTNFTNPDRQHDDTCQHWYSANHPAGQACVLTMTLNSVLTNDGTMLVYDISGAAVVQNAPERYSSATGVDLVHDTGPTTSVVPAVAHGLVICNIQQETNTETAVLGTSGLLFDSCTYDNEEVNGPCNTDQNGGWAHAYNADLNPVAPFWSFVDASATGSWAAYATAWSPPPIATIYRRMPTTQRMTLC